MILSGAGLIDASASTPVFQHMTYTTNKTYKTSSGELAIVVDEANKTIVMDKDANGMNAIYVMFKEGDEITTEPYLTSKVGLITRTVDASTVTYTVTPFNTDAVTSRPRLFTEAEITTLTTPSGSETITVLGTGVIVAASDTIGGAAYTATLPEIVDGMAVLVDCYIAHTAGAKQIDIEPNKFGGAFYLEASTLWRDTNGTDVPAEFVIPNCRVQSNFTFTMSGSGDPSSFTFTMDSFPDYTRWDNTKKVLANIQVIGADKMADARRHLTDKDSASHNEDID